MRASFSISLAFASNPSGDVEVLLKSSPICWCPLSPAEREVVSGDAAVSAVCGLCWGDLDRVKQDINLCDCNFCISYLVCRGIPKVNYCFTLWEWPGCCLIV